MRLVNSELPLIMLVYYVKASSTLGIAIMRNVNHTKAQAVGAEVKMNLSPPMT